MSNWKPTNRYFGKGDIRFIILHGIAEYIKDVNGDLGPKGKVYHHIEFLKMIGLSYHVAIYPDGTDKNFQDQDKLCWHAGKSEIEGISGLNYFSLAVTFIVGGTHDYSSFVKAMKKPETYTNEAYIKGSTIVSEMCRKHKLDSSKIYRHSDVSGPDVRPDAKVDPGNGFDYIRFKSMVMAQLI